ncbi:DNA helicase [Metschnikowia bicuspidata var. bicuspidata NRRL YB-4993]|uniref:DNA helicase n=1 Tax=Metschnikowia bicuspidata var. bicuspidata NRRL YB-4993 TaxID=869754 RepID=A0A1A0HAR6_9ASCO|nr:DNA helicase [Metschnikowia bicuspidata var. bicuspidata NRRL YB-4993]OBA21214.1 DNA helicase [Metschnikowia bicuspidata var. bicuspidata NRRL YB-4993]
MSLQKHLADELIKAIELEQSCDLLTTTQYLLSYSPKTLAAFGLAVINLNVSNFKTALTGKTSIELSLDPALCQQNDEIQTGSLKVGDIVKLDRMSSYCSEHETSLEGVVTRLNGKIINVSLKEDSMNDTFLAIYNNTAHENNRMWIVKLTNSITYKRMVQAMKKMRDLSTHEKTDVIRILLGEQEFQPRQAAVSQLQFWDASLNESQKDAIQFSIFKSPIAIIHGPPGTGKTHTLVELIKQLRFVHGERILVCGASNISVDNLLERLSPSFAPVCEEVAHKRSRKKNQRKTQALPENLIRVGHPARLLSSNLQHSLDVLSKSGSLAEGGDNQLVLRDIQNDIKNVLTSLKKSKSFNERKALWTELKQLKREMREREKQITLDLITHADVVLSTLHGSGSNELFNVYKNMEYGIDKPLFDTIIIDEVSQSLEPQCWIPLVNHLGCRRLVIAGDNQQLPPSVESREEASALRSLGEAIADLQKTLFDRLVSDHAGHEFKKMLNVQYRMNNDIMRFPSDKLYGGGLTADKTVRSILLCDLDGVASTDETTVPCIWYDTQGGDFPEQMEEDNAFLSQNASNGSKFNDMEVLVVRNHINQLITAGVCPSDIGIISPYSAQVAAMKKLLIQEDLDEIEVSTIDGFQGREKEAIIVSLVRSNDFGEVGFLKDFRRLNVAMTRPKRHLCVIGDMELLEKSGVQFLRDWVTHADEVFDVRYPDIMNF